MAYQFIPPTVSQGPLGLGRLFYRYKINRGVTVYRLDGTWYEQQFPEQTDLDASSVYYLGGHEYTVNLAEKTALETAGYTVSTV